jgi:hypothetical protein
VSREPDPLEPGPRTLGAQQDRGPASVRTWTRRLVRSLVLLDSWSPDSSHLSSPQAARRHLRSEWTRSGDLTEAQAAALVALDETTSWTA